MSMTVDVVDPRFDPEPADWEELVARARLRADWAWPVLATQAWAARTPQLLSVARRDGVAVGVVASAWVGPGVRRHRFSGPRRAGGLGAIDVRAPGSNAVPGWWFDDTAGGGGPDDGVGVLLTEFLPAVRRVLGRGLRGALVRQVPAAALPLVTGPGRLVRATQPLNSLELAGIGSRADWLATLSRKRRQSLVRSLDEIDADPTVQVAHGPAADVDPAAAAALLRLNHESHRDVPIVPLPQFTTYLAALFARPDVVALRWIDARDGTLLALAVVLDHPELPIARAWSALPPEAGGRPEVYFHFYGELVRWAVAAGRPRVMLGKMMADLKKSLGAVATRQHTAALTLPLRPARRAATAMTG